VLICTAYIVGRVLWGRHGPRPQLPVERRRKLDRLDLMGFVVAFFFLLLYRSKAGAFGLPLGGPIALLVFFVFGVLLGDLANCTRTRLK